MKHRKLAVLLALLTMTAALTVTLTACGPDDDELLGSVTGVVRDSETNAVLSGVTVFTDPLTKAAVTDADGRYTIADIKVRSYEVVATKEGYFEDLATATVVENATITVNFALDPDNTPTPGSITGVVTRADNGSPLAGASVSTVPATSTVTTNATGQFTITGVAAGSYQVIVTATGYISASSNVTVTAGQVTTANFPLTSNTQGSIAGVVTRQGTSQLLAGVSISTTPATSTTVTDANGHYQLNSVAPGSYRVNASLTGYVAGYVDVTVTAGQQATGPIPLTLAPGSISGTILNATTNDPIAGVTVTTNPSTSSVVTDAGGQYFIDNVPAGDYDVTANAGGYEAQTVHVIVVAGQNYAQNMNLTPFFPEIETNGTTGTANFVAPLMSIKGHIGPDGVDSDDYFRIVIPDQTETGRLQMRVYNTNLPGAGRISRVSIDDVAGNQLDINPDGSTSANSNELLGYVAVSGSGTYYLRVQGFGSEEATYTLVPSYIADTYADFGGPNDSAGAATALAAPGSVTATIGYGSPLDGNDYYVLTAPASGRLQVSIQNLHPSNVVNGGIGRVEVLNAVQQSLQVNSNGTTTVGTTDLFNPLTVTAGATYYVRVQASGDHRAAPYTLTVSVVP